MERHTLPRGILGISISTSAIWAALPHRVLLHIPHWNNVTEVEQAQVLIAAHGFATGWVGEQLLSGDELAARNCDAACRTTRHLERMSLSRAMFQQIVTLNVARLKPDLLAKVWAGRTYSRSNSPLAGTC